MSRSSTRIIGRASRPNRHSGKRRANATKAVIMQGTQPLDIPQRMGNAISVAVKVFAVNEGLDFDLRYHNEPIWLVRTKRGNPYRQIQIAAFSGDSEEELLFIPQAYTVENGTVRATKEAVVGPLILRLPLSALDPNDTTEILSKVGGTLPDAWKKAQSISETDLEIIKEKK